MVRAAVLDEARALVVRAAELDEAGHRQCEVAEDSEVAQRVRDIHSSGNTSPNRIGAETESNIGGELVQKKDAKVVLVGLRLSPCA